MGPVQTCIFKVLTGRRYITKDVENALVQIERLQSLPLAKLKRSVIDDLVHSMGAVHDRKKELGKKSFRPIYDKLFPVVATLTSFRIDDPWDPTTPVTSAPFNTIEDCIRAIRNDALYCMLVMEDLHLIPYLAKHIHQPWMRRWIQNFAKSHEVWRCLTRFVEYPDTHEEAMAVLSAMHEGESNFVPTLLQSLRGECSPDEKDCQCAHQLLVNLWECEVPVPRPLLEAWVDGGLCTYLLEHMPTQTVPSKQEHRRTTDSWRILQLLMSVDSVKDTLLSFPPDGPLWMTLAQGFEECFCEVSIFAAIGRHNPEIAEHLRPIIDPVVRRADASKDPLILTTVAELRSMYHLEEPTKAIVPAKRVRVRKPTVQEGSPPEREPPLAPAELPMARTTPAPTVEGIPTQPTRAEVILGRCCLVGPFAEDSCAHDATSRRIKGAEKYVEVSCAEGCVSCFHNTLCFGRWVRRMADANSTNGWLYWEKIRTQGPMKPGKFMPRRVDPVTKTEYAFLACPTDGCEAHVVRVRKCNDPAGVTAWFEGLPTHLVLPGHDTPSGPAPAVSCPAKDPERPAKNQTPPLPPPPGPAVLHVRKYVPHTPVVTPKTALEEVTVPVHDVDPVSEPSATWVANQPLNKRRDPVPDLGSVETFPVPASTTADVMSHPFVACEALPSQTPFLGLYDVPVEKIQKSYDVHLYVVERLSAWGVSSEDVCVYPALRAVAVRARDAATGYAIRHALRGLLWIDQTVEAVTLSSFPPFP